MGKTQSPQLNNDYERKNKMAKKRQVVNSYVEPHPELTKYDDWCKFDAVINYNNGHFIRIIQFYLFETPAKNASCRSKSFQDYGWAGSGFVETLKSQLFKSTIGTENYEPVGLESLQEKLAEHDMLNQINLTKEIAVFYDREESDTQFMSMFVSLRNAFAHGAFDIVYDKETPYYILENREPQTNEIRARFILKEATLLQWIEIVSKNTHN